METLTWKDRIDAADERGGFTSKDRDLSAYWDSCAIGERLDLQECEINDATMVVEEINGAIYLKGMEFNEAVKGDYVDKARTIYNEIQKLSIRKANRILKERGLK